MNAAERRVAEVLRRTMPRATPMIGVETGAMIIAPMTVAVESDTTPAVAITADSTSIVQKADSLDRASPERQVEVLGQLLEGASLAGGEHPFGQVQRHAAEHGAARSSAPSRHAPRRARALTGDGA